MARTARYALLASLALAISSGNAPADPLRGGAAANKRLVRRIVREGVQPVLREGKRIRLARIEAGSDRVVVRSRFGEYVYRIGESSEPAVGPPDVQRDRLGRLLVEVVVGADATPQRLQDLARSSFRADAELHPGRRAPGAERKSVLTYPQRHAVDALLGMTAEEPAAAHRVGLILPPGVGKTTTSAHYVDALFRRQKRLGIWHKRPKVLFVVQNGLILGKALETYQHELGYRRVAAIYGKGAQEEIGPAHEMIAITRTGYHNRLEEVHRLLQADPQQPWVIVLDEAHHIGKSDGEFARILSDLEGFMDARHSVLTLSATLWHEDQDLVTGFLRGQVHGAFLNAAELEQLQRGESLPELTRRQLVRAMEQGYLKPFFGVHIVRGQNERLQLDYDEALADDMALRIQHARVDHLPDRGVIFVSNRTQANRYARALTDKLGVEVRAFHAGDGVEKDTFDWIGDAGAYANRADRARHKYAVVVDMLNEGADVPGLNLVMTARTYADSPSGFRGLVQNMGRGTRVGDIHLRFIDYSGFSHVLLDGYEHFTVAGGPAPTGTGGGRRAAIEIDGEPVFDVDYRALFWDQLSAEQRFPHFDDAGFLSGGLEVLRASAPRVGVTRWVNRFGVKAAMLGLAGRLPESAEPRQAAEQLERVAFGSHDGSNAVSQSLVRLRIYEALDLLARAYNRSQPAVPIELETLHTAETAQRLVDALLGASLPEPPDHDAFVAGAFDVLRKSAPRVRIKQFTNSFGPRETLRQLIARLPASADPTSVTAALEALGFRESDGSQANSGEGGHSRTRIYRGIYLLARAYNDSHPDSAVDLSTLHTAATFQALVDRLLGGEVVPELADRDGFLGGAFAVLRETFPRLAVVSFTRNHGLKQTLLGLARKLPEGDDQDRAIAEIEESGLEPSDGDSQRLTNSRPGSNRVYRGVYALARAYNQAHPEAPVDLATIHTRPTFQAVVDGLLGAALPDLPDHQILLQGALPVLRETIRGRGNGGFTQADGARRALLRLVDLLPAEAEPERVKAELAAIGFMPQDGGRAPLANGAPARLRVYRGIYVLARAYNRAFPAQAVDLATIHTAPTFQSVVDALTGE